jgi:hypothetical protein
MVGLLVYQEPIARRVSDRHAVDPLEMDRG